MHVARELIGARGKSTTEALRERLAGGESIDVAGYRLSPGLARGLEQSVLEPFAGHGRLDWLEVSTSTDVPSPAAMKIQERWREAGWSVNARVVRGPPFWQTAEIEDAPRLLDATTAVMNDATFMPSPDSLPIA
jgi:hypothetical protein